MARPTSRSRWSNRWPGGRPPVCLHWPRSSLTTTTSLSEAAPAPVLRSQPADWSQSFRVYLPFTYRLPFNYAGAVPHVLWQGFVLTTISGGEGWRQAEELGLALLLSSIIGLEREIHQKSAGLRTHTLVGVGAALFMLVSKYGFSDVLEPDRVILDPSRMAAQIVTGVGFLGAGIIFVRRDSVRGLTTAAAVWVTAAIGACAGAGLPILATLTTVMYLLVALVYPELSRRFLAPEEPSRCSRFATRTAEASCENC